MAVYTHNQTIGRRNLQWSQCAACVGKSTQGESEGRVAGVLPGSPRKSLPSSEKTASPGSVRDSGEGDLFSVGDP